MKKYIKSSKSGGVYIASLYRFGYDLTVVTKSEQEAIDLLMDEYVREYIKENGIDPRESYDRDYSGTQSDYEIAQDEVEIQFYEFNKVEWR